MKPKIKKLVINPETIANLSSKDQKNIRGGKNSWDETNCDSYCGDWETCADVSHCCL